MILVDPLTRQPLGAIPGEPPRPATRSHWVSERDEAGVIVRMHWMEVTTPEESDEIADAGRSGSTSGSAAAVPALNAAGERSG